MIDKEKCMAELTKDRPLTAAEWQIVINAFCEMAKDLPEPDDFPEEVKQKLADIQADCFKTEEKPHVFKGLLEHE